MTREFELLVYMRLLYTVPVDGERRVWAVGDTDIHKKWSLGIKAVSHRKNIICVKVETENKQEHCDNTHASPHVRVTQPEAQPNEKPTRTRNKYNTAVMREQLTTNIPNRHNATTSFLGASEEKDVLDWDTRAVIQAT